MTHRPTFIQSPTLKQTVAVFNLIRKGRKIMAKGELSPDDAVEYRHLLNVAEREFELSFGNDNETHDPDYESDLDAIREVLKS